MSRKRQIIAIAIIFSALLLAWGSWYIYSLPSGYDSESIEEISIRTWAFWTEEGDNLTKVIAPMEKVITEKEDIEKFVQLLTSLKIRPRISSPAGYGGWNIAIVIKRNEFPGDVGLSITGEKIEANGKIYSISEEAIDKLNELFLQEDFGELVIKPGSVMKGL